MPTSEHVYELGVGGVSGGGNYFMNRFCYAMPEMGGHDPFYWATELVNAWNTSNLTDYCACLGDDAIVNILFAKKLNDTGGPSAQLVVASSGTYGVSSGTSAFASDIVWTPGGDANRLGHTFMPAVPQSAVLADVLNPSYTAALTAFSATQLAALTIPSGGQAHFGIYSKKTKNFVQQTNSQIRPKLTGFNKRTLPVT